MLGVIFWGWDAFVLLILYWLETAVIAFWTVVRVATSSPDELASIQFGDQTRHIIIGHGLVFFTHARRTLHGGAFPVPLDSVFG